MRKIFSFLLAVLVMMTAGCATFVKNATLPTTYVPENTAGVEKVEMTYCISVRNPSHISAWRVNEINVAKSIRDYFLATGYFHTVKKSKKKADLHVAFEFIMNANPNEMLFKNLSALCLSLIPVWYSHDAELNAAVYEGGRKSAIFFDRAGVRRVWWAPLMFVGIFKNNQTAEAAIKKKYFNTLLVKMEAGNLLPPKQGVRSGDGNSVSTDNPAGAGG